MDVKDLIDAEAEATEAARDLPEPPGVKAVRRKNGTVLSVRLDGAELTALTALAQTRDIATSTMARSLIVQAMNRTPTIDLAAPTVLEDALAAALRRTLAPELLSKAVG